MHDAAKFWDQAAEKYAKAQIGDMDGYNATLERTRSYLSATDHMLEVGCGTGSTALLLAPHVAQITASDVSAKMVAIGAKKAKDQEIDNVKFVQSEVFGAEIEGDKYDVVTAFNLLHLIEDTSASIRRIHGLLKPGGLFISKTISRTDAGFSIKVRLIKLILPLAQMLGKAPFVRFFSVSELEDVIKDGGFEIVESGNYPANADARYIVARKV